MKKKQHSEPTLTAKKLNLLIPDLEDMKVSTIQQIFNPNSHGVGHIGPTLFWRQIA